MAQLLELSDILNSFREFISFQMIECAPAPIIAQARIPKHPYILTD